MSFLQRSLRSIVQWGGVSVTHAHRGFQLVSWSGWVIITATIIIILPLERAWEADLRFHTQSNPVASLTSPDGVTGGGGVGSGGSGSGGGIVTGGGGASGAIFAGGQ